MDRQLTVSFPRELVDNLADAIAERLREQDGEPTPEGWLDSEAAADYLGVKRRRIYDLTSEGRITPDGRDGSKPLFRRETLDRYARSEGS